MLVFSCRGSFRYLLSCPFKSKFYINQKYIANNYADLIKGVLSNLQSNFMRNINSDRIINEPRCEKTATEDG